MNEGEEISIEIAFGVSMTLCWCRPGKFVMGSPTHEVGRIDNEGPCDVTLSKGFWIGKTSVTQVQWKSMMGSNPSNFIGAKLPVENTSWYDAQNYLNKLNDLISNEGGWKMVLPTDAQWEYACRAGERGPYSGGAVDEVAWYNSNSFGSTNPVGEKKPNAWGIHDMHGNVWEWCQDWYDHVNEELYGGLDPQGPETGVARVHRGGSWGNLDIHSRSSSRSAAFPQTASNRVGFRVACVQIP
jgi:formylglycine-generating enzyme required for sulfatase activity